MSAGFASPQQAENALVPSVLNSAGVDWVLELSPASSPSPAVDVPRHRMLLDASGWIWPVRSSGRTMPFADESVPALLVRHLFWDADARARFDEVLRVLAPGGLVVSVSANPWHRASWRELGRDALKLPVWPRFVYQHVCHDLQLQIPRRRHWESVLPGVSPLLLVVGRKPPRAATVRRLELRRGFSAGRGAIGAAQGTSCRAA